MLHTLCHFAGSLSDVRMPLWFIDEEDGAQIPVVSYVDVE